eukprot:scaffold8211_cov117-Cylindrotheca_fusiformis.AAC.5
MEMEEDDSMLESLKPPPRGETAPPSSVSGDSKTSVAAHGEIASSRTSGDSKKRSAAARRAKRREAYGETIPSNGDSEDGDEETGFHSSEGEEDSPPAVDQDKKVKGGAASPAFVVAEVAPDREKEVEEAYKKGARDAEKALQEAEQLRKMGVAFAVPEDDSSTDERKSRILPVIIALLVIVGAGLLIGLLVDRKDDSSEPPTSPPTTFLPPLTVGDSDTLLLCQGDCDSDADCQQGLKCFQRTGGMDVPGCSGGRQDTSSTDYCIAVADTDPRLEESTDFPLGLCEGDCDKNSDCQDGLICFQRDELEDVPGCIGGSRDNSRTDFCIRKGGYVERFGERLVGSPDDNFGSSVTLSNDGNTMAAGAVDLGSTGYVNIYESTEDSSWNLIATIVGDNIGDQFGRSVELSGDGTTIAIGYVLDLGLPADSDQCCTYPVHSARVRVLGKSSADKGVWNVIGDDIAGNEYESLGLDFSFSLSGDGSILALAEQLSIAANNSLTVYRNEDSQWERMDSIGPELQMDSTVSLSKGAENVRMATSSSNSVQVFELSGDSWQQIGQDLPMQDTSEQSPFSLSRGAATISRDGGVIAFTDSNITSCDSADFYCVPDVVYSIHIYEFTSGSSWTEAGPPIVVANGATDKTPAVSLSHDGQAIAIGEPLYDDIGRVRLFKYYSKSEEWTTIDDDIKGQLLNERFGAQLSLAGSGDSVTLAVGAPYLSSTSGPAGSVTSFRSRLGEKPPMTTKPTAAPTSFPELFETIETWMGLDSALDDAIIGGSVSLSNDGRVLAYGAQNMDSVGAVGVYRLDGLGWTRIGAINGDEVGGGFGHAVSLSGDGRMLAVGIPRSVDRSVPNVGRVRVFAYDGNGVEWSQVGSDIEPGEVAGTTPATDDDVSNPKPEFGHSVALSEDGSILAVGAIRGYSSQGNVDVFRLESGQWIQMGNPIVGPSQHYGRSFGWAVSLSSDGMRLAVGANTDEKSWDEAGAGRIYEFVNEGWQLLGQELLGENRHDLFGGSISLSGDGNIVAIGSVSHDNVGGDDAGYVRIFEYDSDDATWRLLGKPILGNSYGDRCGSAVSLSKDGKTVAIGADAGGYVRVFEYDADNTYWRESSADVVGNSNGGGFGASVALSDDSGKITLVVGSPLATAALGTGQTVSLVGNVYVFVAPSSP